VNPSTKENVMFKLNHDPIYVHVTTDRWDSYGPKTFRSQFLHKLLELTGGINASVQPGWYDFNVIRRGLRLLMSLTPHVE
jgi:hypothetical protein